MEPTVIEPVGRIVPDLAQVFTAVGTFIGSAFAAYWMVRSKTAQTEKLAEAVHKEVKPTTNGEKTLRADVQHILTDVRDLHDDVKSMRIDIQGVDKRLHEVERDVLSIIRDSQARGTIARIPSV